MRTVTLVAFACALGLVTLYGASPAAAQDAKPKDLVIGKWEVMDPKDKGTMELTKDGKMIVMIEGGPTLKGTYKFTADDVMQAELDFGGKKVTQKLKVKVTKTELATTDEAGKVDKYRRVK